MRGFERRWWLAAALAAVLIPAGWLHAQEKSKKSDKPEIPLVVVSVASFERLLQGADTAFESAGRPELSETIGGLLANVNDLKGLQREQPIGLFLYLSGLSAQPVGFVPVSNVDDLLKTVELGPVQTKKTGENTYEIAGNQTVYVKVQGAYAFLSNTSAALDRTFPDPTKVTASLSSAYDIAATLNLRSLEDTTKEFFLTLIRTQTETAMQQRDNEPEAAYRIRRAGAESNLESIELMVEQAEVITVGWGVSKEQKNAGLEFVVVATPGSDLAKLFNELNGTKSIFANFLTEKTPLTLSSAVKLDKPARKFYGEIIKVAEAETRKSLGGANADESPIIDLYRVLKDTVAAGYVDMALKFVGEPPGPFVFVGGVKVADGDLLSRALEQIVPRLKDNARVEIQAAVENYKGVTLHRIRGPEGDRPFRRVFGDNAALYFGAGGRVVWFAVGGEEAVPALKRSIDEVEKPVPDNVTAVPMQFVMSFSSWMDIFDRGNNPNGFGNRARTAFSKGGDALRIDVRGIDNGARFRLQFDEAFIRLVGGEIARGIDSAGP